MPIETTFRFNQFRDPAKIALLSLPTQDLLGPLRSFIGHNSQRTWSGHGFNMIWRPHDKSGSNNQDFFLELNMTKETLSFTDITGPNGIANRGFLQTDVPLGGLAYQQEVNDVGQSPPKPLHFEPGVWVSVRDTSNPLEGASVARMGSIPHGTTINAQGKGFDSPNDKPVFTASSITPFQIGAPNPTPDDGVTALVPFNEGKPPIAANFPARTPSSEVPGLTDAHFADPSKFLSDVANAQNIIATKVFLITTDIKALDATQSPNPGVPHEGGGTDNIAFLTGAGSGPNANAARMSATFWVEDVKDANGKIFQQLQYIQRVLLNFNGLSWPHVSVATMTISHEKP